MNDTITVLLGHRPSHRQVHAAMLVRGLKAAGIDFRVSNDPYGRVLTKKVACWGWKRGKKLRESGHDVLVMERGYVGDRFHYTSLGWNGLNGHAVFPSHPDDGGARFAAHGGQIMPWKSGGDYALILGQVPGDASLKGQDMTGFYERMARDIREKHGIGVYFRNHPVAVEKGRAVEVPGVEEMVGTLDGALAGAAFTACYNSNSSVDSVLAGIPCIVGDKGSMAYEVCAHEAAVITRPARAPWAARLAFRQWSPQEIESGVPLKKLFEIMP